MLVASCVGRANLTTHAGLHAFADEVCADLEAASAAETPGVLAAAITEAVEAGTTEEEARVVLDEEYPDVIAAVEGASGGLRFRPRCGHFVRLEPCVRHLEAGYVN